MGSCVFDVFIDVSGSYVTEDLGLFKHGRQLKPPH
jgi:hypothetical protein